LKKRFSKILGVALSVALLASLIVAAVPVMANVSSATVDVTPEEISEVDAEYVIIFDLGKDLEVSDLITITFPDDTVITPASVAGTLSASPGWVAGTWDSVSTATATFAGNADDRTIVATVATEPIGEGATVRIKITAGITNPTEPGDYVLTVKTSDESTAVESASYAIEAPVVGGFVYVYNPSEILMATYGGSAALNAAAAHFAKDDYTIKVGPGTYGLTADVSITGEGLTLVSSDGAADTIVDAYDGTNRWSIKIDTGGEDVVIDGFTIDDADEAIIVDEDDATVKNCVLTDATNAGVVILNDGTDATISDNTIEDCAIGIIIQGASPAVDFLDIDITGNTITEANNGGAIVFGGGNTNIDITGNTITDNEVSGIFFVDEDINNVACDDISISGNSITLNEGSGIYIAENDVAPTKLVIRENDILDNEVDGILILIWTEASDYIVFNNIYDNEDDNVDNDDADDDVNARFNWWGTAVEDDFDGELEGLVDYEPWLVESQEDVASGSKMSAAANTVTSLDAKDETGVKVSDVEDDGGDGAYIISAAKYIDNPEDAIDDALAFYDVFVALDDAVVALDEVSAKLKFYDTLFTATSEAYFWTGDFWAKCSDQEARSGLVWVTVTDDSSPTVEELEGTPFVVVSTPYVPPVLTLTAPAPGSEMALSNVPFTWVSVTDAASYMLVLSANADLSEPVIEAAAAGTAYTYSEYTYSAGAIVGPLTDGSPYYWQVTALDANADVLATSGVSVFIASAPVVEEPAEITVEVPPAQITVEVPPVEVPPAEVTVEVPPTEVPPTPAYIWLIIGVGAVLLIAVIVLIVRTRRVV